VEAVTRDAVAKAARNRLHPDHMAIVVVGPSKEIAKGLAGLPFGKVELRDAEGEAKKAAAAAASDK
jgi:hypothetical protein